MESVQLNAQRLREYRSKLILFPIHDNKKLLPGEATPEERKVASQLQTEVLPIKQPQIKSKARNVTEEEQKFEAYITLRKVSLLVVLFNVLDSIFVFYFSKLDLKKVE